MKKYMKICRVKINGKVRFGALTEDSVSLLPCDFGVSNFDIKLTDEKVDREAVEFLSSVSPSKIVCVGRNYADHAAELGNEVPNEPLLFLKAPSSIISDGEPIVLPQQSRQVEHEGELAVVIGRSCKDLSDSHHPFDYVFGYLCLNDVTARDVQKKDVQFTRGKSFDTFCPVGMTIETELDPLDLKIEIRVNRIIKQSSRTSRMVFPVDFLIRYISRQMTLLPGDVIATGTPSGVSELKTGDVCEVEIEGVGVLSNPVR